MYLLSLRLQLETYGTINETKTKYMGITKRRNTNLVNGYCFERVDLGTLITDKNEINIEINNHIMMTNRCFFLV